MPIDTNDRLDPAQTALLFFDLLNVYVKKEDPATREMYKPIVANAVRLLVDSSGQPGAIDDRRFSSPGRRSDDRRDRPDARASRLSATELPKECGL